MGPISYADSEEKLYGGEVLVGKAYSEATAVEIDREVKRIMNECYDKAKSILNEHRHDLELIGEALLKYEVLESSDVDDILAGRPVGAQERLETQKAASEKKESDRKLNNGQAGGTDIKIGPNTV